MKPAKTVFNQYLRENGKLYSKQREQILDIFLKTEQHPTINDLHDLVKKRDPKIGLATVYRTMEVICNAGLARKVDFGGSTKRYEHKHKHQHHDHLVCLKCGRIIEVMSPGIEKLQERLAKKHKFSAVRHRMEIFGICRSCNRKKT
ncbi:MAG: transcriptional repressor [Planctomycetes bacterium B3_Pla]|nr:MAG: transcriptional repressor [Planctomycetes bacterium B3_Pla]